jgi:hypothetical protein
LPVGRRTSAAGNTPSECFGQPTADHGKTHRAATDRDGILAFFAIHIPWARIFIMIRTQSRLEPDERFIAIYHCVYEQEGFEATAQSLFELVKSAEKKFPGKKRRLYLDIEGHKNSEGGFDSDMMEIQTKFLTEFLGHFLTAFSTPLGHCANPKPQDNDLPPALVIRDE